MVHREVAKKAHKRKGPKGAKRGREENGQGPNAAIKTAIQERENYTEHCAR